MEILSIVLSALTSMSSVSDTLSAHMIMLKPVRQLSPWNFVITSKDTSFNLICSFKNLPRGKLTSPNNV